mmetsp:Transcript_17189/g.41008  ORF Transcript_17189/g.41008 Transcript_17189/m.41008 type:complete len:282 (-) Transcript_17189:1098-1943(-)
MAVGEPRRVLHGLQRPQGQQDAGGARVEARPEAKGPRPGQVPPCPGADAARPPAAALRVGRLPRPRGGREAHHGSMRHPTEGLREDNARRLPSFPQPAARGSLSGIGAGRSGNPPPPENSGRRPLRASLYKAAIHRGCLAALRLACLQGFHAQRPSLTVPRTPPPFFPCIIGFANGGGGPSKCNNRRHSLAPRNKGGNGHGERGSPSSSSSPMQELLGWLSRSGAASGKRRRKGGRLHPQMAASGAIQQEARAGKWREGSGRKSEAGRPVPAVRGRASDAA